MDQPGTSPTVNRRWVVRPRGRWLLLILAGATTMLGILLWRPASPPGVTPEVVELLRDLRRQPAAYQRLATSLAGRLPPNASKHLPRFLKTHSIEMRRLEACHRLVALGPSVRPAAPMLAGAVSDADPTVAFYGFLAMVYSGTPAAEAAALIAAQASSPSAPSRFYASLLATEDDRVREFAWQCLETSGAEIGSAKERLEDLAASGEPELRKRAAVLLKRMAGPAVTGVSVGAGHGQAQR